MLVTAVAIGLLGSSQLSQKHQFLGLLVSGSALIQQVLGFASKTTLQDRASGYFGIAHSGLGFSILFVGWFAMFTGMQLGSVSSTLTTIIGLLSGIEITTLVAGSLIVRKRQAHYVRLAAEAHNRPGSADELFALEEYDSEDEQEKMMGNEAACSSRNPIHTSRSSSAG